MTIDLLSRVLNDIIEREYGLDARRDWRFLLSKRNCYRWIDACGPIQAMHCYLRGLVSSSMTTMHSMSATCGLVSQIAQDCHFVFVLLAECLKALRSRARRLSICSPYHIPVFVVLRADVSRSLSLPSSTPKKRPGFALHSHR